ncbi:hypothetical protein J6590_054747 [Homalodisca vitripennis]|nr:hypothetical protein J6590_054747 [Homalodisca vitripennis]
MAIVLRSYIAPTNVLSIPVTGGGGRSSTSRYVPEEDLIGTPPPLSSTPYRSHVYNSGLLRFYRRVSALDGPYKAFRIVISVRPTSDIHKY